ncbi:MAG: hypothetical protein NC389_17285 [Acetatifactor muris]|nr:hypothetical protein [Acetatifactor muris]
MNNWKKIWQTAGLLVAGMLALSACGEAGEGSGTEQSAAREESTPEPEISKAEESTPEPESSESEESTPKSESSESEESTSEPKSSESEKSTSEPESSEPEENGKESAGQKEKASLWQGTYPSKVSVPNWDGSTGVDYFFDEEGVLVKSVENSYDGRPITTTIEYITDAQGKKIYGITDESFESTYHSTYFSVMYADKSKLVQRPLFRSTEAVTDGSALGRKYTYEYDEENRVVSRTDEMWGDVVEFTYETQGGLTVTAVRNDENKSTDIYQFNQDNFLTAIISGTQASLPYRTDYVYDENGNLIGASDESGDSVQITRDSAGNILKIEFNDGNYEEYDGYNANGDWTICTCYNGGKMAYFLICEYNEDGSLSTKDFGIGTDSRSAVYDYDEKGRLIQISVDGLALYQFSYNGDGLLERAEKVNEYQNSESESLSMYDYVLSQAVKQDMDAYVIEYTGIEVGVLNSYWSGGFFEYGAPAE